MGMKCPKYDFDNSSDSRHSKKYVTPLFSSEEVLHNHTLKFETLIDEITTGATIAGKYQIFEER